MSNVRVNDAALNVFLRDRNGPIGRDLERRAAAVQAKAQANASGQIIGVRSGDLIEELRTIIRPGPTGDLEAVVGSTAIHRGFGYPAYHDQRGRPWLTEALREAVL